MSVDRTQALAFTYSLGLFGLVKPSEHCLLERKANMPDKHMVTTLEPGWHTQHTCLGIGTESCRHDNECGPFAEKSTEKWLRKGRSMWARGSSRKQPVRLYPYKSERLPSEYPSQWGRFPYQKKSFKKSVAKDFVLSIKQCFPSMQEKTPSWSDVLQRGNIK